MRAERILVPLLVVLWLAGCGGGTPGHGLLPDPGLGPAPARARSATSGRVAFPGLYRADTGWWYLLTDFGPGGAVADSQFLYGGDAGDLPVYGDWDGDAIVEVGVYRRTTGRWYLMTEPGADLKFGYGGDPADLPVVGDFDGDGRDDPGVYRASTGSWYLLTGRVGETPVSDMQIRFPGGPDAIPAVGDFDGDDRSDLALYNRTTGVWSVDLERDGDAEVTLTYGGAPGDLPVVGDFDGDGRDDPGIYRPSNGWWYLLTERTADAPVADVKFQYGGDPSDIPTIGDYNGDGTSDPGVYRRSEGLFFLLTERNGSQILGDLKFRYGGHPSDLPLTPAPLLAPLRPYPGDLPDSMLAQVTVEPAAVTIPYGLSADLTARGRYLDGSWRVITDRATWTSTSTWFPVTQGTVTARTYPGTATIRATLAGLTGSATATASPAVIVDVTMTPQTVALPLGSTQRFTVTGTPSGGHSFTYSASQVAWATSDPLVAAMVEPGMFQGVNRGTATITATVDGFTETATVTVGDARIVSLALSPQRPLSPPERDVDFRVVATYTDGLERDVTGAVTWTTSAPTVASLAAEPGRAQCLAPGSTTITARDAGTGQTVSTKLVVTRPEQVVSERFRAWALGTNPAGDRLYVQRQGRLDAYDTTTLQVVQSWALAYTESPCAFSRDGRLVATLGYSNPPRVDLLDLTSGARRVVYLTWEPLDVIFGREGRLYVLTSATETRHVEVADTTTGLVVANRKVSDYADAVGHSHALDRLLVSSSSPYSGMWALDASNDTLPLLTTHGFTTPSKHLFLTGDGLEVLTYFTSAALRQVAALAQAGRAFPYRTWYDLQGVGGRLYSTGTGEIIVNDAATLAEVTRIPVALNPLTTMSLAQVQVSGDGKAMAVYASASDDQLFMLFRLVP